MKLEWYVTLVIFIAVAVTSYALVIFLIQWRRRRRAAKALEKLLRSWQPSYKMPTVENSVIRRGKDEGKSETVSEANRTDTQTS